MITARRLRVQGVVQGVGFRPFVFRLAQRHGLAGWVRNADDGVQIHVEGGAEALASFAADLAAQPPAAAEISRLEEMPAEPLGLDGFAIRASHGGGTPATRIPADLPVCDACLAELFTPGDRRQGYPYINCTDCGPRFSIVLGLPYDRALTTMRDWPMCADCTRDYHDPLDRRFHAQPVACPRCGPHLALSPGGASGDEAAIQGAASLLAAGRIVAVKGLGGYHLACDALDAPAAATLRQRKFRKEKPFAIMAGSLAAARRLVDLSPAAEELLTSRERPIVLAPARREIPEVAPGNRDLGVMLPYTPLHHLLFAHGAPELLVMTSANRSSEPIAYGDTEARERLGGIADAFLAGERPIARRVDDSVARVGIFGPAVLRRARGFAPGAVARLPVAGPILALGGDLKSAITLVVDGEAFVSQHLGDLDHYAAYAAFREAIADLTAMYQVHWDDLCVAHDLHPEYRSTACAADLPVAQRAAVQHHGAHIASVLAEHEALDRRVVGVALDGTGYGDDGAIWGGEIFVGSVLDGFTRAAHLRPAVLAGGDAAARHPVQAAAGFLAELSGLPDLMAPPFSFPRRYLEARQLLDKGLRTFPTTSTGRLFDTAAALLGFTREITFEGQAAIWVEQLALAAAGPPELAPAAAEAAGYAMPFAAGELDPRPLLGALIADRAAGRDPGEIARLFHRGFAHGVASAVLALGRRFGLSTVALSGGVFQNEVLCGDLHQSFAGAGVEVWTQRRVPCNDGGLSLGQAALAAVATAADAATRA
jgi:hydrogenase maturation protein HypF